MPLDIKKTVSFNNRLILEPYTPRALETKVQSGFASISQASQVHGLKVLVDAYLSDQSVIPAGSTAFVRESVLHTNEAMKKSYEAEGISGKFIICDLVNVEFVAP